MFPRYLLLLCHGRRAANLKSWMCHPLPRVPPLHLPHLLLSDPIPPVRCACQPRLGVRSLCGLVVFCRAQTSGLDPLHRFSEGRYKPTPTPAAGPRLGLETFAHNGACRGKQPPRLCSATQLKLLDRKRETVNANNASKNARENSPVPRFPRVCPSVQAAEGGR